MEGQMECDPIVLPPGGSGGGLNLTEVRNYVVTTKLTFSIRHPPEVVPQQFRGWCWRHRTASGETYSGADFQGTHVLYNNLKVLESCKRESTKVL